MCERVDISPGGYRVQVRGWRQDCACPLCGRPSRRVHSRYQRLVKDLPIQARRVVVVLEARKFFCDDPGCPRRIFCERFPDVVEAYARRTRRLDKIVTAMGLLGQRQRGLAPGAPAGLPGERQDAAALRAPLPATASGSDDGRGR